MFDLENVLDLTKQIYIVLQKITKSFVFANICGRFTGRRGQVLEKVGQTGNVNLYAVTKRKKGESTKRIRLLSHHAIKKQPPFFNTMPLRSCSILLVQRNKKPAQVSLTKKKIKMTRYICTKTALRKVRLYKKTCKTHQVFISCCMSNLS